jgi:hypothetical protein
LDYQRLGPFTIIKKINEMAFQLKLLNSMKIHHVFNVCLMKPYHASTIPRKVPKPLSPIEINGEQEYEMEEILDLKISNN